MSYIAYSNMIVLKTDLINEDLVKLDNYHFEEDNVGYLFKFNNKERTKGVFAWINNYKYRFEVGLKEEYIEFIRKDNYFILLVSSSRFVNQFKNIVRHSLNKEKEIKYLRFPLNQVNESYRDTLKEEVKNIYDVDSIDHFELSTMTGIRFNFKNQNKVYFISYDILGCVSFGMGKSEEDIMYISNGIIELDKHLECLIKINSEEQDTNE